MQTFPIGAIVKRRLDGFLGTFTWHWGIYLGNGEVAHFNGFAKKERSAIIRIDSVDTFRAGHRVVLHRRPETLRDGIRAARKARELNTLAENGFNGAYQFFNNNCQDFCRHCCEA